MTRSIRVDGRQLEFDDLPGRDEPILMMHEGLGSLSLWRDFPARVAAATGRRTIAWSRAGYGRSDEPSGERSIDYLDREADTVPLLLDALGIARAHFLGHSDGGSIALILGACYPDRAESLIILAPHIIAEPVTLDSIRATIAEPNRTLLCEKLGRHHNHPDRVLSRWSDVWLDPSFRQWSLEDRIGRIVTPCLMIQGYDDEYGTMRQLDLIEAAVKSSRRLNLRDCGHAPHRDQPELVLKTITSFLADMR